MKREKAIVVLGKELGESWAQSARKRLDMREPFTEPYTLQERLEIHWHLKKYDWRRFKQDGIWGTIAFKLPHRLAYWTMVRVVGHAWVTAGNKHPDELTYEEICRSWDARKAKA